MTISEKIQCFRKKSGLSQEELAGMMFVSRQTISLWETGQTLPTIDNLIRLREIFGVSLDTILCDIPSDAENTFFEKPCESYTIQYTSEEISSIRRLRIYPWYWIGGMLFALMAAVILRLCFRTSVGGFMLFLSGGILAILLSALAVITVGIVTFELKFKQVREASLSFSLNLYKDFALLEKKIADGNVMVRKILLKDSLRAVKGSLQNHLGISCGREILYIPKKSIAEDSPLLSAKAKPRLLLGTIIALALAVLLSVIFLVIRLFSSLPLERALRDADVTIPEYVSISESKVLGLVNGKYVSYYAEIYFDDSAVFSFEKELPVSEKWKTLSDAELAPIVPDADIYRGAEYFTLSSDDKGNYTLLVYFADENLMKIQVFSL